MLPGAEKKAEVNVEFGSPNCPNLFEFGLLMSAVFVAGGCHSFEDPSNLKNEEAVTSSSLLSAQIFEVISVAYGKNR